MRHRGGGRAVAGPCHRATGCRRRRWSQEEVTVQSRTRWLIPVLWGTALHSFLTGVLLLLQPAVLLRWGGFTLPVETFFPAQGGVFHILMAALYAAAAVRRPLWMAASGFIVFVKASAAVFLLTYYIFVSPIWLVLLSGMVDGGMASLLAFLKREEGRTHVTG